MRGLVATYLVVVGAIVAPCSRGLLRPVPQVSGSGVFDPRQSLQKPGERGHVGLAPKAEGGEGGGAESPMRTSAGSSRSGRSIELYPSAEDRASRLEVDSIKNQLLQVSAMSDRGQQSTEVQREDVELLVSRLQEMNPPGALFKNSDMAGTWTLVYSSSQLFRSSPFFASLQSLIGRRELTDQVLKLAGSFPMSRLGQVKQTVDEINKVLISQVEIKLFPARLFKGVVQTEARIVNDDIGEVLDVIVEKTRVVESTIPMIESWNFPLDWMAERFFDRLPRVALETVFLDKEMRVTRLVDGSMFIYVRDLDSES